VRHKARVKHAVRRTAARHRVRRAHAARKAHPAPRPIVPDPAAESIVAAAVPAVATEASSGIKVPGAALFVLVAAFALLLLAAGVAAVPEQALPSRAAARLDGRRGDLLFAALCAVGVGLVAAILATLVSS
jgi:hypothetical protein